MSNAAQNLTVRQLAEQLGVTKQTIQNRADALGIVFEMQGNKRIVTPEQAEQIRQAMQTPNTGRQERQQRRSSRKADADTAETDSATLDLLKDQLRRQTEEIQFLRSLVVSLQNEKSALLQLAEPVQPSTDEQTEAEPQSAADLPKEPEPTPSSAQEPESMTLWDKIKSFFMG